jgi:hypothetical protein
MLQLQTPQEGITFASSMEEVGQIQTAYPFNQPWLRSFFLQNRYLNFLHNLQDSTLETDGGPPHNGCRGIFVLQLPIANSISCRDRRIPADTCCLVSIRQIVAQTMQAGARYQLSTEQGAIAVSFSCNS